MWERPPSPLRGRGRGRRRRRRSKPRKNNPPPPPPSDPRPAAPTPPVPLAVATPGAAVDSSFSRWTDPPVPSRLPGVSQDELSSRDDLGKAAFTKTVRGDAAALDSILAHDYVTVNK